MTKNPGTEETTERLKATVTSAIRHVRTAQLVLFVIRPVQYVLAMAYYAAVLYTGTWIVVLALKHSGALR